MLDLARFSFLILIVWQPIWFAWLKPAQALPVAFVLAILTLPLLICLPWVWRKRPRALVLGGCMLLLHFSVAVMELWTTPEARLPAAVQVLLTVLYYVGVFTGLRRR